MILVMLGPHKPRHNNANKNSLLVLCALQYLKYSLFSYKCSQKKNQLIRYWYIRELGQFNVTGSEILQHISAFFPQVPGAKYILLLLLLLSHFSCVRLCGTPEMTAHQAPLSLRSPGKNTGVGFHFLLQCMKGKSESEVAQSCPTLRDPMDCSLPGSSVHGVFQARVLEQGAIAFSKEVPIEVP